MICMYDIVMNNIWSLHKGWLLPNKKQMKMVILPLRQGWLLPLRRGEIPYGGVALVQGEELKFLAGINHNTPFVFIQDIHTPCMVY